MFNCKINKMLTPDYIAYLENLPCNTAARQRAKPVGSWMATTQLVREGALENEDLLTTAMAVTLKQLPGTQHTIEVAQATSLPRRSSIRRSTPEIGEGDHGKSAVSSVTRWSRSARGPSV